MWFSLRALEAQLKDRPPEGPRAGPPPVLVACPLCAGRGFSPSCPRFDCPVCGGRRLVPQDEVPGRLA